MKEYIEREAAIQALGDEPEIWCERDPVEIQEQNDWNYYKHCIEAVPAADVVEVRHGRWIFTEYEFFTCSVCGESYYNGAESTAQAESYLNSGHTYKYCPNCGARMDKEDKHEAD